MPFISGSHPREKLASQNVRPVSVRAYSKATSTFIFSLMEMNDLDEQWQYAVPFFHILGAVYANVLEERNEMRRQMLGSGNGWSAAS